MIVSFCVAFELELLGYDSIEKSKIQSKQLILTMSKSIYTVSLSSCFTALKQRVEIKASTKKKNCTIDIIM